MTTFLVEIMRVTVPALVQDWERLGMPVKRPDPHTVVVEGQAGHYTLDLADCTLQFTGQRDKITLDLIDVPVEEVTPT